jgi:hypothetical protein
MRGKHEHGPFHLGKASFLVTGVATLWLIFETVNICWPRYPDLPWYQNWGTIIMVVALGLLGVVAYYMAPSHESKEMM